MALLLATGWRVVAVAATLVIATGPYAKFAANYVGDRYTVRWEEQVSGDSDTIGIHNSGANQSRQIHLHFAFPGREILDFVSRSSPDAAPVSFLETFRSADLPQSLSLLSAVTLSQILDLHMKPPSVTAIRHVLKSNLEARIHQLDAKLGLDVFLKKHPDLLAQCAAADGPECNVERLVEDWEHQVALMRARVCLLWQQQTGGQIEFPQDSMGTDGEIDFF